MTGPFDMTITNLDLIRKSLDAEEGSQLIDRIFDIRTAEGRLIYPDSPEFIKRLGEIDQVKRQKIIKVTNIVTWESALFNELRSRRPLQTRDKVELEEEIRRLDGCHFCIPKAYFVTPGDTFIGDPQHERDVSNRGRIQREACFSASNFGKYDGYHGLVIFKDHDPFSFELLPDYVDCALEWAKTAHEKDREAIYFFLMWNCLWKAGGSIIHGHIQMSLSKGLHYGKVEHLLRAAKEYQGDYFRDLFRIHELLGLGFRAKGVEVMAYLTPIKEKETLLLAEDLDEIIEVLPKVLRCFYDRLAVRSFNLALVAAPHAVFQDVEEEEKRRWDGFPLMVRIVDRGDLKSRTADMGAMELYASSVISSDPYRVIEELKQALQQS
jgi:hypothetical protein